ncbi:hypothetical protein, partial [Serratia sp. Ag2]
FVIHYTASEVDEIFETLSEQILQEDSFGKKPVGIDGIQFLVQALPQTQRKLLDFIRRIPVPKTGGSWLGSAFMQCFVDDTHEEEFRSILQGWAEQSDNSKLSISAKAMLDLPGKRK